MLKLLNRRVANNRKPMPRRRRGAALLEMVVVFMVLFYLVMGGMEFGWFMYAKHMVQSATRDGARAGIISTATQAQAASAITSTMTSANFQNAGYTVKYERITTGGGGAIAFYVITDVSAVPRGEGLRVTISAPFSGFGVRPLGVIPATKQVIGVSTMIKE